MYCKNLLVRKKKYKPYFYCKEFRQVITLDKCEKCLKLILRRNKGIKKVSKNKISVKKEIYEQVFERDKGACSMTNSKCEGRIEIHHVRYRSERKDLINDITNCICLCSFHHKLVHSNKKKYQPLLLEMLKNKL